MLVDVLFGELLGQPQSCVSEGVTKENFQAYCTGGTIPKLL